MRTILVTALATAAFVVGGTHDGVAAPHPPTGNAAGAADSATPRNPADLQFLEQIDYDDRDYATQDAAIELARAECAFLDSHGNTPYNRTRLAEITRRAVRYPYLFLEAAVRAICPWNRL
ncbi:DUF732 domain-containing protein [Nocardia arizonensis]|uniref:DUF732 domain-containing protein n=1 Tax=Nocardia arizonensis TaxID=1141647 RepID=UPI0006D20287|nr:DUF732 domain-containing protein [Nocardia arizonensis]